MTTAVWVLGAAIDEPAGGGTWRSLAEASAAVPVFGGDGAGLEEWLRSSSAIQDLTVLAVVDPGIGGESDVSWGPTADRLFVSLSAHFALRNNETAAGAEPVRFWWWIGPCPPDQSAQWEALGERLRSRTTPYLGFVLVESWLGKRSAEPTASVRLMRLAIQALVAGHAEAGTGGLGPVLTELGREFGKGTSRPFHLAVEEYESPERARSRRDYRCAIRQLRNSFAATDQPSVAAAPSRTAAALPPALVLLQDNTPIEAAVKQTWDSRRRFIADRERTIAGASAECVQRLPVLAAAELRAWRRSERSCTDSWSADLQQWWAHACQSRTLGGIDRHFQDAIELRDIGNAVPLPPARIVPELLTAWDSENARGTTAVFDAAARDKARLESECAAWRTFVRQGSMISLIMVLLSLLILWKNGLLHDRLVELAILIGLVIGFGIAYWLRVRRIAEFQSALRGSQAKVMEALIFATKAKFRDFIRGLIDSYGRCLRAEVGRVERLAVDALRARHHTGLEILQRALAAFTHDEASGSTLSLADEEQIAGDAWMKLAATAWADPSPVAGSLQAVLEAEECRWLESHAILPGALKCSEANLHVLSSADVASRPVIAWILHDPAETVEAVPRGTRPQFLTGPDCRGRFLRCELRVVEPLGTVLP